MEGDLPSYSLNELSRHKSKESALVVIHGIVYDVTKYLNEHPGGLEILLDHAGKNATEDFESIGHSEEARSKMKEFAVGKMEITDEEKPSKNTNSSNRSKCHCEII